MINRVLSVSVLAVFGFSLFMVSCSKEETGTIISADNYVTESIENLEDSASCGKRHCFEFVFPISIVLPDSTIEEVADYDELKSVISAWREANPDAEDKPSFVFPLDIMLANGELVTIEDQEELREVRSTCRRKRFRHHLRHKGRACFRLIFPLSIEFPDGSVEEVADRPALHELLRTWKSENPDAEERPSITFPVTVLLKDGTTQTVESAEELEALKEDCQVETD